MKNRAKQLADRKLKEFVRWRRIAGKDYRLLQEYQEIKKQQEQVHELHINKETAIQECEEIIKAVNSIQNSRHRELLSRRYGQDEKIKVAEIYQNMRISENTYCRMLDISLIEFAESYKSGLLIAYMD